MWQCVVARPAPCLDLKPIREGNRSMGYRQVHLTREESSTRVLSDMSLYNITRTPILKDDIIASQKNDEGMAHIKRRMEEGDLKVACFHEDAEGTLWFNDRLVVSMKELLKKKILDEANIKLGEERSSLCVRV
jgi:hypothetical protein